MKLLLIDPSTLLNERLERILANLDCVEVVEATTTVEDATRVMQSLRPEIVVMNAWLPDGEGIGVLARVRAESPSACLIVMSHDSSAPYKKRWLRAGADYCLDLPVQIELLLDVVTQRGVQCRGMNS